MYFQHSSAIWRDFPQLVPGVLVADGITSDANVEAPVSGFTANAQARLAAAAEGELPEIQAWRQIFARMGLKPTRYRCAAEALLRRYRKDGSLPRLHPLIDLCNAVSLAYATPVAAFDMSTLTEYVEVCYASGDETYDTFSGETETPDPGEVVFADAAGRVHARRWTNRQSGYSAVRDTTSAVLIVAEAMHAEAPADLPRLTTTLADELSATWPVNPITAILSPSCPQLEF